MGGTVARIAAAFDEPRDSDGEARNISDDVLAVGGMRGRLSAAGIGVIQNSLHAENHLTFSTPLLLFKFSIFYLSFTINQQPSSAFQVMKPIWWASALLHSFSLGESGSDDTEANENATKI